MTKEQIIIGNKLIADFAVENLGWKELEDGRYYFSFFENKPTTKVPHKHLSFHKYWNWLMPVWIKIGELKSDKFQVKDMEIQKSMCFMQIYTPSPPTDHIIGGDQCETLIEATFLAIVDFVTWYNKYK